MLFRIHPYFKRRRDIKKNSHALRLAQIAEPLYSDSRFSQLSGNLMDERLSVCCLLNWALTIAECAVSDPMPLERIAFFERQLAGRPKLLEILFFPLSGRSLEAHETAAIWGAVFYWLVAVKQTRLEKVMDKVLEIGLRDQAGHPYFAHFILAANNENKPRNVAKEKEHKSMAHEESVKLSVLEQGVMAFPSYREQMGAFSVLNNMLVGHNAWNKVAPMIRNKILKGAVERSNGMNVNIENNYGSVIDNNYGNNSTQQLRTDSREQLRYAE